MQHRGTGLKKSFTAVIRATLMAALFTAVFLIVPDITYADGTVLTVQKDGVTVHEFDLKELQTIEAGQYSYSAWDSTPELHEYGDERGPAVADILSSAGVIDDLSEKNPVTFTSSDGSVCLTGKQLLGETRYYYPHAGEVDHAAGLIPDSASDGKKEVPAIIAVTGDGGSADGLLCVGQTGPNEENDELFINGLINDSSPGVINVSTKDDAPKCAGIKSTEPKAGSICDSGTEVTLAEPAEGEKICYTFKGSPAYGCPIYNYGTGMACKPVLTGEWEHLTLSVKVKCYGKQDSSLQTFSFSIGDALRIIVDGEVVRTYNQPEDVTGKFDTETFSYSGFNSNPKLHFREDEKGIRVENIIKDATGKDTGDFDGNSTISFTGSDGYGSVFTMEQLFGTDRFYFPNAGEEGEDSTGGRADAQAYEGKQAVPVIIQTGDVNKLMIGQSAPNDQNLPECVDHMLNLGTIEIVTDPAEACTAPSPLIASGSVVQPGTAIKFTFPPLEEARNKLYYIIDAQPGEVPGPGDDFYFYAAYHYSEGKPAPVDKINPPVLRTGGKHTITYVYTAYGKQDSQVKTLTYYVTEPVGKPSVKLKAGKKRITVKWSKVSGASGYVIYRSTRKNKGFKAVKTITSGSKVSYVNKKLKRGKKYYYKVIAYKTVGDKRVYGSYSSVKYKKAK